MPSSRKLTEEELDAILLGLCYVLQREDWDMTDAAEAAIAKIVAMLPAPEAAKALHSAERRRSQPRALSGLVCFDDLHTAIHEELKLRISYRDAKGAGSLRTVWPITLDSDDNDGIVLTWCETRNDFRNFRLSRIQSLQTLDRYPLRRRLLLAKWGAQQDEESWY